MPSTREDAAIDLRDFFTILRKRIGLIAAAIVIALVLAGAYLATATKIYTGSTSLLIDTRSRSALGENNTLPGYSPDAVLVESQVKLIASPSVLRRVVESEHLQDDPEFVPAGPGLRARLMAAIGLGRKTIVPSADDKATGAMLNLAPRVTVDRSERTYIVDIHVTSRDPAKAASLANAVARSYLVDQKATRTDAATRDNEWVLTQIADMQAQLRDAEVKAQEFKRASGIIDTNGKVLNEQELADAAGTLTQARARVTEVKSRLDQVQRINTTGRNIDALPDAIRSPSVEKLRSQYADISRQQATLRQTLGDRHPALLESEQQMRDVRRLIADELKRVQAGLVNEYQTAQANVQGLDNRVQALKQANSVSNENRVKLDELQRDVDARRAVYDRFLRARDTVREQSVDAPIGRIIAPALTPMAPSSPRTFAVLSLALGAGAFAGMGMALVADLLSMRRRRPEAVQQEAAVPTGTVADGPNARDGSVAAEVPAAPDAATPVLGFVPLPFGSTAHASRAAFLDRLRTAWPTSLEAEHIATLPGFRASVQALGLTELADAPLPRAMPRTIVVASIGGSESRTTLSLGLAEAVAAAGRRTLVIDADEKAGLLREIVTTGARPALIDLMGTARLCYRIVSPSRGSLGVVPIIAAEAQIAHRLAIQSDIIQIDGIAGNFDLVIFDGPSIRERAKIEALASSVDMLILVAPKAATRAEIDRTVSALQLPPGCSVAAVLAADATGGVWTSAAA